MRDTIVNELNRLAMDDKRISIMTADLGYGVFEAFAERYPERFFNVGISEQLMASAAAGMALCGNTVFIYSIGNFATLRCIEQIRNDICYHCANVKVIAVGGGFSYGQLGMSHHATEDIAMMRALPNMRVMVPADPEEALAVVREAVYSPGPCYIRLARRGEPVLYPKKTPMDITRLQQVTEGQDAALLTCGPLLKNGIDAAERLKRKNISVSVFSVPCIKPIDSATVWKIAQSYPLLVTAEEHNVLGGLGGAVAECVSELEGPRARLCRLGLQDEYTGIVGSHDYLCEAYGLDGAGMADKIAGLMGRDEQ